MKPEEFSAVVEAFSGVRAVDAAARIQTTDAEFTFPAFHRTSRNVVRMMEQAGLQEIETYSFRADGSTKYGDWTVPRAWDVKKARLQIEQKKGFTTIADRNRHFCSVIMYSAPTPGGKTYECSIVQEKDRKAWQGNLVFADNPGKLSHKQLAQEGAAGIVTDYMPEWEHCRTREDVYDTVLWNNSSFAPANRYGLIGFQLSPREGDRIRALFSRKKRKIRARALVDSALYDGTIDFVTGLLPGQQYEAEEVGVFAHLFEPGANDNASGCALGLESLRVMKELTEKGDLKPLKRPVRLCYTLEVFGTLAFFESFPDKMKRITAGINPDMVGPDMEKCRSRLYVYGTPASACSYVDSLISGYIETTFKKNYLLRWSERPFFINDNFVTDPAINIPCPALVCLRDRYYHSNEDTADNLSPETMHAIGSAMTGYLYDISRGEYDRAKDLADRIMIREIESLDTGFQSGIRVPLREFIEYRKQTAERRLRTLTGFLTDKRKKGALSRYIGKAVSVFDAYAQARAEMAGAQPLSNLGREMKRTPGHLIKKAQQMIPRKTVLGTVSSVTLNGQKRIGCAWSYDLNAPLFWADGTRSVYEIWRNSVFEFQRNYTLKEVITYFEDLEQQEHAVIQRG